MTGALRAEWTKLRTDNGTAAILAAICILTVAVGAATAAVTRCGGGAGCAAASRLAAFKASNSLFGIYRRNASPKSSLSYPRAVVPSIHSILGRMP